MKAKTFLLLLLSILTSDASWALEGDAQVMSNEFKREVAHDIEANFAQKITSLASKDGDAVLDFRDQKVMMRTLYAGISGPLALAGVQIDSKTFYSKVGSLLHKGAQHGVLPSAITIGWYGRLDLIIGKTRGTEMNFYLEKGKLRVSSYDLKTLNVGVAASAKIGYYVALCFGSCTGGDANGNYVGLDADLVYGLGASVYIEVGVDSTDYYKAKKEAEGYALSEMYDCKAIYIGVGMDMGLSLGFAAGFTDYRMTSDKEIIDLYSILDKPNFNLNVANAFMKADLFKNGPRLP